MSNKLSAAILGWKSPVTTRHSLETYAKAKLYDCCDEFFVYYNQYSPEDKALCDEMGVRSCGTSENSGNWGGHKGILATAKNDIVLFLENDHPVIVSPEETKHWIDGAVKLIAEDKADIVLLRHRDALGEAYGFSPKNWRYYFVRDLNPAYQDQVVKFPANYNRDTLRRKIFRLFNPSGAIRRASAAVYLEREPENVFPRQIRREGDFLIVDSSMLNFSESPFMISRAFYEKLSSWAEKHPRHRTILGMQNLEYILNCRWWRKQHFRIAQPLGGVFGHERKDDSWRPNHGAYSQKLVDEGKVD